MQIKDILQKTTEFFKNKGFDNPRLETELLISTALNWQRMKLYLNHEYPLSEAELNLCRDYVKRRASGEPAAYIVGHKGFYKHDFKVTPAVLIPRPETEELVEQAVAWATAKAPQARIVDLGTGSGAIGLSMLAAVPGAKLLAVDISEEALKVAQLNSEELHGTDLKTTDKDVNERAHFLLKDAGAVTLEDVRTHLGGAADMVLANPPYIAEDDPEVQASVKKFEPHQALFSGENGLQHVRAWAQAASEISRPGAFIMFEIGHEQGKAAKEIFEQTGSYDDVSVVRDLSGRERFIRATRNEEN
jgi:release factor glutamine methyltransferase